jgi:hypothetical protein
VVFHRVAAPTLLQTTGQPAGVTSRPEHAVDDQEQQGPPMICATSVMRPGRMRIGQLGGGVTLPRTIPIINLFAAAFGALVGLGIGALLHPGLQGILYGVAFGSFAGWLAVTYSPLKNESLLKWFELKFKASTRSRYVNGRRVTYAVGTAVVPGPPSGDVLLQRSAVHIPPTQYDERGVLRAVGNRNLNGMDDGTIDAGLLAALAPLDARTGATELPTDVLAAVPKRSAPKARFVSASPADTSPAAHNPGRQRGRADSRTGGAAPRLKD